jgi:hypothetical protein
MNLNDKGHQGKFHLLAILLIPVNLTAWFITSHWLWGLITNIISAVVIYFFLFRKPT